jgi:hypothetical protein
MDKKYIIDEIKRFARTTGETPGESKFEKFSGIRRSDWFGVHWSKWSDATTESGLKSNEFNQPHSKDFLLRSYLNLVVELGKLPTSGEIRLKGKDDRSFPSHSTFSNRLGAKIELLEVLLKYAEENNESQNVIKLISEELQKTSRSGSKNADTKKDGCVYLIKTGDFYKVGRSNDFDRRLREIKTTLPEEAILVHAIETDDAEGIEKYWHNRFDLKRGRGEWFKLSVEDIKAFRKRKFM